jgi:hypothetical protein
MVWSAWIMRAWILILAAGASCRGGRAPERGDGNDATPDGADAATTSDGRRLAGRRPRMGQSTERRSTSPRMPGRRPPLPHRVSR